MAGAPDGCWKGALPGAEGWLRSNWGRGKNARLRLSSAVGLLPSLSPARPSPQFEPPDSRARRGHLRDTRGVAGPRGPTLTPSQSRTSFAGRGLRRGPAAAGAGTTHGAAWPRPGAAPAPRRASPASQLAALARSSRREAAARPAPNVFYLP